MTRLGEGRVIAKSPRAAPMALGDQLTSCRLVCPITRQSLQMRNEEPWLDSEDGSTAYRVTPGGVPILLLDEAAVNAYVLNSTLMTEDYARPRTGLLLRWQGWLRRDFRTQAAKDALAQVMQTLPPSGLALSVGGGPGRAHPALVNLNIGSFENVDIVADAHRLPYADGAVDVVHSEAVFEHLAEPRVAASELFRVLKPGGLGFVCTPFLQQYHGYPHHYQNFTLHGHRHLFEASGFEVLEGRHAVGPVVALVTLISAALKNFLPRPLNALAWFAWAGVAFVVRPLDHLLEHHPLAHTLASTTYLVIRKPERAGVSGD